MNELPEPMGRAARPGHPRVERRRSQRRRADRDLEKSNRHLVIGNYILSMVLVLTVLAGLGMILKGCADFGSPFTTDDGY